MLIIMDMDKRHDRQRDDPPAPCDPPPNSESNFFALWLRDQFAALRDAIDRNGRLIMASAAQLNEELIQINAATTAIAESNAEIVADIDALKATAAKHTPGSSP